MNNKRFKYIITLLLALSVGMLLLHLLGISVKDVLIEIVTYTITGVLGIVYLSRFVLMIWGVFAIYRLLQQRYYRSVPD